MKNGNYFIAAFLVSMLLVAGCTQGKQEQNKTTEKTCPVCPQAGEWSECFDSQQKRTSYVCDSTTGFECTSYVESRNCTAPVIENKTVVNETKQVPEIKEFNITAKQFEFIPSTITINKGDKVRLRVKSIDVTHGFSIPALNVNEPLGPNTTVEVEFTAFEVATYDFMCTIYCGTGHSGMRGRIIVLDTNKTS